MPNKPYKTKDNVLATADESVVAYESASDKTSSSGNSWNPNVPFQGTQEEWWEHFHRIEESPFMSLEEFDEKFETWKKEFLASRLK
jgi:hypothetical protein